MGTEYWTGGPGWNLTSPPIVGAGTPTSGQVVLGTAAAGDDTLLRTSVQGRFMFVGFGNGTTNNPAIDYWPQLEGWVGIWSDGGDTLAPVPIDPFDAPSPTPPWVWTSFLTPVYYPSSHLDKGSLAMLTIPPEDRWSKAQRKGRPNPVGSNHSLYLCWSVDAISAPFPGTTVGGVSYALGADIDVRALWYTTH